MDQTIGVSIKFVAQMLNWFETFLVFLISLMHNTSKAHCIVASRHFYIRIRHQQDAMTLVSNDTRVYCAI